MRENPDMIKWSQLKKHLGFDPGNLVHNPEFPREVHFRNSREDIRHGRADKTMRYWSMREVQAWEKGDQAVRVKERLAGSPDQEWLKKGMFF